MPRKVLVFVSAFVILGGLVFGFFKFSKAAQTPALNSVTPISACGFGLNFTAAETATKFEVQTATNSGFNSPKLPFFATDENGNQVSGSGNLNATTTSHLTGYPAGEFYNPATGYYFHIRAYAEDGGVSGWSKVLQSTTNQLTAPGAPQNLNADGRDDGFKIYLSWERGSVPPNFDAYGGFQIWRAASDDGGATYGSFSLVQKVPANFLDYEDCNVDGNGNCNWLNRNYSYKYYLKATQSDRGCAPSQFVVSVPSNEATVPVAPSGVAANVVNLNPARVEISWIDNSHGEGNENRFEIWRSVGNDTSYTSKYQAAADAVNFTDSNVQSSQIYYYKLKACHASGPCSAFSNEAQVSIGAAPVNDLAGSIYFADGVNSTVNIYLSWSPAPGNVYTVLRKEDVETAIEAPVSGCAGNQSSQCYDLNVPLGKKYKYRLKIENGGDTLYSNVVSLNSDIRLILKGNGWSSAGAAGIGWLKFQSDKNAAKKYSVQIDSEGFLSGAAWASKNYGWLSFNKSDLTDCPTAPCEAKFDSGTNFLSGWGRFLVSKFSPGEGSLEWLKLKGSNYGVEFISSTRQFSGLAWGDAVAGWTAFGGPPCAKCNLSADILGEVPPPPPPENQPPVVSDVALEVGPVDKGLWCSPNPFYDIRWSYSDPEHQPQAKAEIRLATNDRNDFATTSEGSDIGFRLYDPLAVLQANTNYDAWVRVSDGQKWSEWVRTGEGATTPSHYPPFVGFSWSPTSSIAVGQPVTFTDTSEDRSGGNLNFSSSTWSWNWEFPNGTPSSSMESVTVSRFSVLPSDVSLTVGDAGTLSCGFTKPVGGAGGPPRRRIFRER